MRTGVCNAAGPLASAVLPTHAPSVLACAATGIVPFIERNKGDVDRIFGRSGLAPDLIESPTYHLSLASYCNLFEISAHLTHNDNFGLWFGRQFNPRDLGLWGYAALSAPTLGDALETLVELFPLHQQSSMMSFRRSQGGLAKLAYRIEAPEIQDRRQDAELSLGIFSNLIREALGTLWSPEEVHFEHPQPEGGRNHERAFSAPVLFSQPTNALFLRPEELAVPMPGRDPRLQAAMRHYLARNSHPASEPIKFADRVRGVIRGRLATELPTLDFIAAELRTPVSVIRRELNREGLSFRELVEFTRRDLALYYVRQSHLTFSEIAFLLAYSEVSAFSRAVLRWTGRSPRELRRSLNASDPR